MEPVANEFAVNRERPPGLCECGCYRFGVYYEQAITVGGGQRAVTGLTQQQPAAAVLLLRITPIYVTFSCFDISMAPFSVS
jgi:hypothetical protein